VIALAAECGATRAVMNSGAWMTGAHQLYCATGFTRLTERETRTVEGHTRPLLAFGYEVATRGVRSGYMSRLAIFRVPWPAWGRAVLDNLRDREVACGSVWSSRRPN
jgi:hypothetical protein